MSNGRQERRREARAMAQAGTAGNVVRQESVQMLHYEGSVPPPEDMERYERLLPGLANRFMEMAEREQGFVHAHSTSSLERQSRERKFGQVGGLIITLGFLSAGAWLIHSGHEGAGTGSIFTSAAGIWVTLIRGLFKSDRKGN